MDERTGHGRFGGRMDDLASLRDMTDSLGAAADAEHLLLTVMENATRLLDAERSTLLLIDAVRQELWSKIAQQLEIKEIRMPLGRGVAGGVAATGETVNLPDAYADQRFDPSIDQQTGYRTRSLLCMPVNDAQGARVGVIQVLNKKTGAFTPKDEAELMKLCGQAGILIRAMALSNAAS
ncbi:MAG: GAF domain-containing protein [Chloroflexi bacterium]|nr:GAF domain-containing protein [Chloroflexota bacterium]